MIDTMTKTIDEITASILAAQKTGKVNPYAGATTAEAAYLMNVCNTGQVSRRMEQAFACIVGRSDVALNHTTGDYYAPTDPR